MSKKIVREGRKIAEAMIKAAKENPEKAFGLFMATAQDLLAKGAKLHPMQARNMALRVQGGLAKSLPEIVESLETYAGIAKLAAEGCVQIDLARDLMTPKLQADMDRIRKALDVISGVRNE